MSMQEYVKADALRVLRANDPGGLRLLYTARKARWLPRSGWDMLTFMPDTLFWAMGAVAGTEVGTGVDAGTSTEAAV